MSKRIAIIEPSGNLYGSEFCLLDILQGLAPGAFDPLVYLPRNAPFRERLQAAKLASTEGFPGPVLQLSKLQKLRAYASLATSLRAQRPDLLYINEAGILRPMLTLGRLLQIPILCQVQTREDAEWISALAPTAQQVPAFICNSSFIAKATQVPEPCKSTVYYGYRNKGLARPRPAPPANNQPLICGLLGRIGGSKGHDLVLEAAQQLRQSSNQNIRFRFIGEAPSAAESATWRKTVTDRGLGGIIEFRGYQTDIAAELAELHLMIIPSRCEPFGRILCEAAEAQCPVLLSDSGGLGELSRRFNIGERHQPTNAADFASQLCHIRHNYQAVQDRFLTAAPRFLGALDYRTYIAHISNILHTACQRQPVSNDWFGATP